MDTLASLFGGGGGGNAAPAGGSLGESLGMLAGAGLGTLVGPAGTAVGAGLGKALGGGVERMVRTQTTRPAPPSRSAKRRLSQNEQRILANGQEMTRRTGNPAYAEEASLRVYRPAEYRRRRAAGTLPTQGLPAPQPAAPASRPPSAPRIAFPMDTMHGQREAAWMTQQFAAQPAFYAQDEEYNETAAPDPRPRPLRHTSVTPLPREYMEALVRDIPAVKSLDPRLLRLASGTVSVARDVSGVDPSTGTYHALTGETPHGITKKLTGQVERVAELLAANPGKQESSPVWNIPPGWLVYDRETGALATARKYVVQQGDSPFSIAKKLGASGRPKWFSELRTANPQKPVKNGNFASLHAGEELGVPDDWPENPLAVPVSGAAPPSQSTPQLPSSSTPQPPAPAPSPGLPGAGQNSTMDPGAILQVQLMLARWGRRNPAAINPIDFGNTYDFTSTMTPRTVQAVQSFQLWWNRERPLRPLRMDGVLDNDTMAAIKEAEQVASSYPQMPGMQVPSPPQPGQTTQQYPFPQSPPPGWPANIPWPPFPIPGQTAPQQPQPAPQQQSIPQQPQPVPQQQQPAPQQQQPAPQPQPSQTAPQYPFPQSPPPGWPSNVPWPPFPIPGQTAPQQQQPAPQQQQQPPYGWPWGWPWGQVPGQQPQQQQPAPQQQQQQQPAPQQGPAPAPFPFPFPNLPSWSAMPNIPNISSTSAPAPAPAPAPTGQTAPSSAFPPFDAHMPEDQRQILRHILQNETRVDALIMGANMYDAMGYPLAGQACRARAVALAAILDSHMPEDLRQIVRSILQNETRAESLDWAANVYEAMGYPMAAQALRSRSQYLKAAPQQQVPGPYPMPAPVPYPAPVPVPIPWFPSSPGDIDEQPPVVTYPPDDGSQTAGNDPSLMPMLALLGAGLAFT